MRDKVLRFFVVDDRYKADLPSKFDTSPSNSERKKNQSCFLSFSSLEYYFKA